MKYSMLTLVAVLGILAAGCIDYEQTITVNEDLSGEAEFNIAMSPYLGDNLNEDGSMSNKPTNFLLDDYSNKLGCSVKSDSYSYDPETELEYYSIGLFFDNLNDINGYGLYEKDKTLSVAEEEGSIIYREKVKLHETPPPPTPESEMTEDDRMFREMMEGFTFTYRAVMPNAVTDTNGKIAEDGRTVVWIWPASEFIQLGEIEVYAKCAK